MAPHIIEAADDGVVDLENRPPQLSARRSSDTNDNRPDAPRPPSPPPMSARPPRVLVIGAGSRGRTYARCTTTSSNGVVVAVAEPDPYKREQFGRSFIWGRRRGGGADQPREGEQFEDWREYVAWETARQARVRQKKQQNIKSDAGVAVVDDGEQQGEEEEAEEGVDAVFVCVRDEMHRDVVVALAPLGLHIMCEKPLATTLDDCVAMYRSMAPLSDSHVFSIGHVLRYSPHNMVLRRLLHEDRAIGDILSIVHTEPVGWWHFSHSYVRGNWRRESTTAPSLLTKSCHDIDLILWLLCSPPAGSGPDTPPHLPTTVASSGALQFFRKSRKPKAAGKATNCLSCPHEPDCMYSSKRVYVGPRHQGLATGNTGWPLSIVMPDIESFGEAAREPELLRRLAEDYDETTPDAEVRDRNWFGRCVFESNNDVCDEQVVTMTWDEDPLPSPPSSSSSSSTETTTAAAASNSRSDSVGDRGAKQATFHMIAQTKRQCQRYTHIYGTEGEIYADSWTITVEDFRTGQTHVHRPKLESLGHGGGDVGLTRQFILAVDRVKNHGWPAGRAQREFIGCGLEEVIRSHAMVFAAEEARTARSVVDWKAWWDEKVGTI